MVRLKAFFLAVFLLSASAFTGVNAEAAPDSAKITGSKANGEFEISVFKDDKWQKAASLTFDQFFREKTINITPSTTEGPLRVKITQKGGEAAHIDSVFLGNMPPVEVKGTDDPLIMKKISKKDFDVIDALGKEFELVFNNTEKASTINITARIEGTRISETPFQYPVSNLYKKIDSKAEFYTYKLDSKANKTEPFFKEYSVTGSGHPSGYTYGWVSNDEKNLYVKIDFTPDDTMDGPKDYTKVYVKTEAGIKEFKVSVPETKWGNASFTYTDKVAYQHKLYDFAIPLTEIGIKDAKKTEEIQVAFAAYGTAAPPGGDFNSTANNYLVVYGRSGDLYGWLIDSNGNPVGTEITISNATNGQYSPSVAYNSLTNQYLIVWSDYRSSTNYDIYGQLVDANGTLSGINFAISTAANSQSSPSVVYNSITNQYLVVWYDYRSGTSDIYGQLVDANGTLSGTDFAISTATFDQLYPSVTYNSSTNQYLVVWHDYRSGNWDIYGQLVDANGTLSGSDLAISTATFDQYNPSVTYNSRTNQYLIVWQDQRSDVEIYGQLVNANGTLSGSELAVSTAASSQYEPSVAYNSLTKQYLVAWYDYRNPNSAIYGQYLTNTGALTGGDFLIVSSNSYIPHTVANTYIGNYLVAYYDNVGGAYAWVIFGEAQPGRLQGTVTSAFTTKPIANAQINLNPQVITAFTDSNGFFEYLHLPVGLYDVTASAFRYTSGTVNNVSVSDIISTKDFALACNVSFTDVSPGFWAENYIKEMYCKGITTGCSTNPLKYCPDNSVTRAQMAKFIIRGMGETPSAVAYNTYFDDVANDLAIDGFAGYINRMKELGITTGCGTRSYCPNNSITRGQVAKFIIRGMGETPSAVAYNTYFDDVANDLAIDGFAGYINRMKELGITTGCGTRLYCPNSYITRAQMAVFIIRAF